MLTGWTFEYIDNLGVVDASSLMQTYEAEQHLKQPKRK